jgi:hypothetical protein
VALVQIRLCDGEELDDVVQVDSNLEISEEVLAQME